MGTNTSNHIKNRTYPVKGLSCASCAISVESILKSKEGVKDVSVNFASKNASVTFDEKLILPSELKKAVQAVGYDLDISTTEKEDGDEDSEEDHRSHQHHHKEIEASILKRNTIGAFVLSIPVFIIGMFFHHHAGFWLNLISFVFTAVVLFWFGQQFFVSALKKAKYFQTNMDTLVALSTGVAFVFSGFNLFFPQFFTARGMEPFVYFETSAVIITFILLGKLLEKGATDKAFSSIKSLMELQVKTATVIENGKPIEKSIKAIRPNEMVMVKPGEKIPIDGIVMEGDTYINESMISGESVPVFKTNSNKVLAGTINLNGSIIIQVKKLGDETVLGQIIKSVQKAQDSKAPIQKLVDKVTGVFVPVVIVISILTFIAWAILGGASSWVQAIYSCVTVLIIACPCALGLATPIAIMVGVGRSAKEGILIKDAQSLEIAHKITTVVLDKTGTLTEGKPIVKTILWNEEINITPYIKNILYSLERKSEHPLAKAVVEALEKESIELIELKDFNNQPGRGVRANVNEVRFYVGNKALVPTTVNLSKKLNEKLEKEAGNTLVYFSNEENVLAIIVLSDKLKAGSKDAVVQLINSGKNVHLLTGDNEETAKRVSAELGISNYKAAVMPGEKLKYIESLQNQNRIVAMVGDGINDSEALAKADVSIAMASGADIAMDVASITLMNSDPRSISQSIRLSAATMKIVKQNLFWAFIYNIVGIPLATGLFIPITGWHINPMLAGAAMAFSSVSVVLNSLRLKFI